MDHLLSGAGADADRLAFTRLGASTFASTDRIGAGVGDAIDLSALDRLIAGELRLVNRADVTGAVGEVWVEQGFGVTQVLLAADDRPGVDGAIRLDGPHTPTADDLVLCRAIEARWAGPCASAPVLFGRSAPP